MTPHLPLSAAPSGGSGQSWEKSPQPLPDEGEWISIAGGGKREASQQLAPSKGKLCLFFFFWTFFPLFVYLVELGLRGSTQNLCGASRTLYLQPSDLVAPKHVGF